MPNPTTLAVHRHQHDRTPTPPYEIDLKPHSCYNFLCPLPSSLHSSPTMPHHAQPQASYRPGAALLLGGVACRHVSARLFLASYGEWAGALLDALRRDTAPAARAACLLALAQLFGRWDPAKFWG